MKISSIPNHKLTVLDTITIQDFLLKSERIKEHCFVVYNKVGRLVGTVSTGDVRRYLLSGGELDDAVTCALNKNCEKLAQTDDFSRRIYKFNASDGPLPIVNNDNSLVEVYDGYTHISRINTIFEQATAVAPCRVTFAGGGTDISTWYSEFPGKTINCAIAKYARVTISPRSDRNIEIISNNSDERHIFDVNELNYLSYSNLITCALNRLGVNCPMTVHVYCDAPIGSGLGGSSALVVALIKVLERYLPTQLTSRDIIGLAYEIERMRFGILGGWQDFIPSVMGGINATSYLREDFHNQQMNINPHILSLLESELFLVKVGSSRKSSEIHSHISREAKKPSFEGSMQSIKELADEVEISLLSKNKLNIASILQRGWDLKRQASPLVSNKFVDELYDMILHFGATGGRLLGAGKSGYLMVCVPHQNQAKFITSCDRENIAYERLQFSLIGAQVY